MNKVILILNTLVIITTSSIANPIVAQDQTTEQEVLDHGKAIRDAFASGDVDKIRSLHHPEVLKALAFDDIKNGREEVMEGLVGLLASYDLAFIENNIENIWIRSDVAIEQTRFAIRGTSKNDDSSFLFKGRTMVTYVRYDQSPTGWVTIREIIQPATE